MDLPLGFPEKRDLPVRTLGHHDPVTRHPVVLEGAVTVALARRRARGARADRAFPGPPFNR